MISHALSPAVLILKDPDCRCNIVCILYNYNFLTRGAAKIQSKQFSEFGSRTICFKSHTSLDTSWIPANEGAKFNLDSIAFKIIYVLLIYVINFTLRLVNFVYIFLRHPVEHRISLCSLSRERYRRYFLICK